MPEEIEEIELRSEEVNEILSRPPSWVISYGIAVIFISIFAILIASWFIRYPDIIAARVVITSASPPAKIIAKEDGPLNILVSDDQTVTADMYLGVIKNEAETSDILILKSQCDAFRGKDLTKIPLNETYNLGMIQQEFHVFQQSLEAYRNFIELKYYERQINSMQKRREHLKLLSNSSKRELSISGNEKNLAQENFAMDSLLYAENAASKLKRNQSKSNALSADRNYEQLTSKIVNIDLQLEELKGRVQEMSITREREDRNLRVTMENAFSQLEYGIKAWEQRYVLSSPVQGKVILNKFWSDHQFSKRGDEVFTVVPLNSPPVGRTELPIKGSGKVEVGQRVVIKLDNFPYREYGTISGRIESKSTLPVNNSYALIVTLPKGMTSSYKKDLGYEQELNGTAEIITHEFRLLERVFNQFRALLDDAT